MQNKKPISFENYKSQFLTRDRIQEVLWSLERQGIKKSDSQFFDQQFDEELKRNYDSLVSQDLMFFEE